MKQLQPTRIAFLISAWLLSCNQAPATNETQASLQTTDTSAVPVEGAWKLVWAAYNDTLADMRNHILVKMFTNGSFSLFAHDSAGKMAFAGYGKYDFEGDKYHETFLYHNETEYTGGEDWQNLEVKGDTMYMNGFTKIVVGGKEMTTGWTKTREKLVKVAW